MKKKLVALLCVVCSFCVSASDLYHQLMTQSDVLMRQEKWNDAVELLWRAACVAEDDVAFKNLSAFYNRKRRGTWYNWRIPEKYLQQAADRYYKLRNYEVREYTRPYIIVAQETAIINKLGTSILQETWSGNKCCQRAMEALCRKYYIIGHGGTPVHLRSVKIKGLGDVAILDSVTAKQLFRYDDTLANEFNVMILSKIMPGVLVPFEEFHQRAYKHKMGAFIKICQELGAKKIYTRYSGSSKNTTSGGVNVKIADPLVYNANVKALVEVARTENNEETVCLDREGSRLVRKIETVWFEREPTWHAMYVGRRSGGSTTKYSANFDYTESNGVTAEAAAAFNSGPLSINIDTNLKNWRFAEQHWIFKVEFPRAIGNDPRPPVVIP